MAPLPEQQTKKNIDRLQEAARWHVCDVSAANIPYNNFKFSEDYIVQRLFGGQPLRVGLLNVLAPSSSAFAGA